MVFPTEKPHLLKPCFTSIDGSEAVLPRENRSALSPDSKALPFSVSFCGWRFARTKFRSWVKKMAHLHEATWKKAGIFEAVMASTYNIHRNTDLVLGIAEKWCQDTNTFVFPWGETTVTLEDVMVLLGFSVLGLPVFTTLDSAKEKTMGKLEKEWLKIKEDKVSFVTQVAWMKRFMDSGDELEHVAFLSLWLSYYVFPSCYYHIYEGILPIAVHLSTGTRMALAPAVLAHLYAELSLLKTHIRDFNESVITEKTDLTALFKLVQVWIWERFEEIQPKPNPLLKGEPRLARWSDLKQRTNDAKRMLENSNSDSFEWRPYTRTVKKWEFPKFYPEKAMWVLAGPNLDDEIISFSRCIKVSKLVGIDCVEHYFPNRVTSQFGMLQTVPDPLNRNNLSQEEAWDDYNKPIFDTGFYIPSRSAIRHVTPTFCEWWSKSFPEFQSSLKEKGVVESAEPLESRTIIGDDTTDYGMKRPVILRNRRPKYMKARRKRRKYMKRSHENDVSTMGPCQIQVPSHRDDDLTIAQIMRLRNKKNSDVKDRGGDKSKPLGKRSRREEDNNVPSLEIKQRKEDTDETISKTDKGIALSPYDVTNSSDPPAGFDGANDMVESAPETIQTCDDELDIYGSNAEKMNLIDDDRKDTNCLLHEDGAMRSCAKEKAISIEKLCSEAEKEDGDRFIQKKLELASDNHESNPCKKLASGDSNGDETSKAGKSMILSPSHVSNNHIAVGHGTQGKDCLFLDVDEGEAGFLGSVINEVIQVASSDEEYEVGAGCGSGDSSDEEHEVGTGRRGSSSSSSSKNSGKGKEIGKVRLTPTDPAWPSDVPDTFRTCENDWRPKNILREVIHQGNFELCWAVVLRDCIEAALNIKAKRENMAPHPSLSAQHLVNNVSKNKISGAMRRYQGVSDFLVTKGLVREDLCPYTGEISKIGCTHLVPEEAVTKISALHRVKKKDINEAEIIKLVNEGPVMVETRSYESLLKFKGDEIYRGPGQREREQENRHALLVVGYGTTDGIHYWIVKNSYGVTWGNGGYGKIIRQCSPGHSNVSSLFTKLRYPEL